MLNCFKSKYLIEIKKKKDEVSCMKKLKEQKNLAESILQITEMDFLKQCMKS